MPNRKTFDEQEKYDHSAHRTSGTERGDLSTTNTNDDTHAVRRHAIARDQSQRKLRRPFRSTPKR